MIVPHLSCVLFHHFFAFGILHAVIFASGPPCKLGEQTAQPRGSPSAWSACVTWGCTRYSTSGETMNRDMNGMAKQKQKSCGVIPKSEGPYRASTLLDGWQLAAWFARTEFSALSQPCHRKIPSPFVRQWIASQLEIMTSHPPELCNDVNSTVVYHCEVVENETLADNHNNHNSN